MQRIHWVNPTIIVFLLVRTLDRINAIPIYINVIYRSCSCLTFLCPYRVLNAAKVSDDFVCCFFCLVYFSQLFSKQEREAKVILADSQKKYEEMFRRLGVMEEELKRAEE